MKATRVMNTTPLAAALLLAISLGSCAGTPENPQDDLNTRIEELENLVTMKDQELETAQSALTELENLVEVLYDSVGVNDRNSLIARVEALAASGDDRPALLEQIGVLESEIAGLRERVEILSTALNDALFAQKLFDAGAGSNTGSAAGSSAGSSPGDPGDSGAQEGSSSPGPGDRDLEGADAAVSQTGGRDLTAARVENIAAPAAVGRSPAESIEGSRLVSQQDGQGITYIRHRDSGVPGSGKAYLEIQQRSGVGISLYLVLQLVRDAGSSRFGLTGGEISLAGSFLYSLPQPEYREELIDASRRLERIYIPAGRTLIQALGSMIQQRRGEILLSGLYGEESQLMDEITSSAMQEVLAAFLDLAQQL